MNKKISIRLVLISIVIGLFILSGCTKIPSPGSKMIATPQLYIYGTLLEINELGEDFSGPEQSLYGKLSELKIMQEIKDCEKVDEEEVIINAFLRIDGNYNLETGKKYLFKFHKINENEEWGLKGLDENFDSCSDQHKYDLYIDRKEAVSSCEEKDQGCVPHIIEEDILLNDFDSTYLEFDLINRQDNELSYSIRDLKIIEEIGGFEIPRETSEVETCLVTDLNNEKSIGPKETQTLSFKVDCNIPEKVICQKCELEYQLSGKIIFEDELGFEHELNNVIFKYNLKSDKISKETLEYPPATEEEVPVRQ